jgi:hypothetical protein
MMSLTIPHPLKSKSPHEKPTGNVPGGAASRVLPSLTMDLRRTLGILATAPQGIPELTIATLGLGSQLTLRGLEIVDFKDGDLEASSLRVTKLGLEVIDACAAYAPARVEVAEARERASAEAAQPHVDPSDRSSASTSQATVPT